MAVPDYAKARRELRSARVHDALNEPLSVDVVSRYRDMLLQLLAIESVADIDSFDSIEESKVDSIISIALASVAERAEDSVLIMLMCITVLAADGQFARLSLLANRLASFSRQFRVERPYWELANRAFAHALKGQERHALRELNERLGVGSIVTAEPKVSNQQQMDDVLAAAALRSLLAQDNAAVFNTRLREIALTTGDGGLLVFLDAVNAWHNAATRARPHAVLQSADPVFLDSRLLKYLAKLNIATLFPAQINAVMAGATHDVTRMVALPTSSGKTLIAEFRIAAALTRQPGSCAIYVAPYRLLSRQVESQLKKRLNGVLGFEVHDLGTGYDPTLPQETAGVVICTPERLDALLRLASTTADGHEGAARIFDTCSVLVFDELHLVGRSGRGPRFELLLARLRSRNPSLRILGLAAASHGSAELSRWLNDPVTIQSARRPTGTLELLWETGGDLLQRVDRSVPAKVGSIVRKAPADDTAALLLQLRDRYQPALAICTTRSNAESIATKLHKLDPTRGLEWRDRLNESDSSRLNEAIEEVRGLLGNEHPLGTFMEAGIAFHHAGVPTHALQQIEALAKLGILRAVAATTTVAEGADLPFRVVVIPHLNFPGETRKLERDLYLNIIGRAGRAGVAVEGMVFILESDAPTLKPVVRGSLWSTSAQDVLRGKLGSIATASKSVDSWTAFMEFQSQVLAWLGDGDSYKEDQAESLAELTFTYSEGNRTDRARVTELIDDALVGLESAGLAVKGSPYRLTERGGTARLAGLCISSVRRLEIAVERGAAGWLSQLPGMIEIDLDTAIQLATIVFEAWEVFEHGLWMRRNGGKDEASKFHTMQSFTRDLSSAYNDTQDHEADIELLANWIMGSTYGQLADIAPSPGRANALFGGTDSSKLVSDATEFVGKLVYHAGWAWSAATIVAGALGSRMPQFIRGSIEFGLPNEGAVWLVTNGNLTRQAALAVVAISGPTASQVRLWVYREDHLSDLLPQLTQADLSRLRSLRESVVATFE